ncbi:hypothetical protein, partial [Pseudomonas savastanoi]|uniref:hypothetical protein n=1 Tax=Pseudomonas savastanoi TaxID=29438 RepID=UPI001C826F4C
ATCNKGFKKLPTDIPTISVDNFSSISNLKNPEQRKRKFLQVPHTLMCDGTGNGHWGSVT